jgi:UDP-glucuronate 4-epimerase
MDKNYVLVTGAAGFIGSRLVTRLLEENRNVIALDCFLPNLYSAELKKYRWSKLGEIQTGKLVLCEFDLRVDDFSNLLKYKIDTIYNEAAMPGLSSNWGNFAPYYDCNLSALNRLLEFSRGLKLNSFVQASTSSVYGKNAVGPESQELNPTSPYGVSKLAAEKLLLAYLDWFNIPVKILRYFSVYGPYQRPDMAYAKIIDHIKNGNEFTIFGDGTQARSNTYIDDVVEATVLADTHAKSGDIINICGDETVSLNEAISIIERLTGKKLKIRREATRIGDQKETSGANFFAKKRLGWNAKTSIEEGLSIQVKSAFTVK